MSPKSSEDRCCGSIHDSPTAVLTAYQVASGREWVRPFGGRQHSQVTLITCWRSNPAGGHLYAGDGWGVAYASLSLRLIDMNDGRELARLRTKYQQPRSITYRASIT